MRPHVYTPEGRTRNFFGYLLFMAHTRHLPLYAATFGFTKDIYRLKAKLPKAMKHELGQEAFHSAIKALKCIVIANQAREKTAHIARLLLELEVLWVLLRLMFELRGISEGEFQVLSERLATIDKQAQAWLQWQQKTKKSP